MKVLRKGKPQRGWATEAACSGAGHGGGGCGARLRIEEGDLFHPYRSIMGREEEWDVTFQCPECGVLTDLAGTPFHARRLPERQEWERRRAAGG